MQTTPNRSNTLTSAQNAWILGANIGQFATSVPEGLAFRQGFLARQTAADILMRGNAGNLPGPAGFATRLEYATTLRGGFGNVSLSFSNPATMVGQHPFGPTAASTLALQAGANRAATLTPPRALGGALNAVDPLVHGYVAGRNAQGDGYDRFFAGLTGAVRRVDNVGVSVGAGVVAAGAVTAGTGGAGGVAAPAVGVGAGIAAGAAYENSRINRFVDSVVDNTLGRAEPYLASGARTVGNAIGGVFSWAGDRIRSAMGGSDRTSGSMASPGRSSGLTPNRAGQTGGFFSGF